MSQILISFHAVNERRIYRLGSIAEGLRSEGSGTVQLTLYRRRYNDLRSLALYAVHIKCDGDPEGTALLPKFLLTAFKRGLDNIHILFCFYSYSLRLRLTTDGMLAGYFVLASAEIVATVGPTCSSPCSSATSRVIAPASLVQSNIRLQGWLHDCF